MKINNCSDIRYDLNNANEKAYYDEYQKYKDTVDEYFQGKIKAADALAFLRRGLAEYQGKVPEGRITDSRIFSTMFCTTRINQIQALIDEIETHEAEGGGTDLRALSDRILKKEEAAIAFLVGKQLIESRGSGIPSTEPAYRICKSKKVTNVYEALENEITSGNLKMDISNIPNFLKKTICQFNRKPVDDALNMCLKRKNIPDKP